MKILELGIVLKVINDPKNGYGSVAVIPPKRYLRRFTMKNGRYSDAQIMAILKQAEGGAGF